MTASTEHDVDGPLTYANAPRFERGGRAYVDRSAMLELARRIAKEDKTLLDQLAEK